VCSPRNSFGERKTCRPKGSLTGIRGVYLVAAELAKRDYIASPTSRSAAGADLLVTDASMQRAFSVQVKTNGKAMNFWLVGKQGQELVILPLDELQALGIAFTTLGEGIDTSTPAGRQLHLLSAVAAF